MIQKINKIKYYKDELKYVNIKTSLKYLSIYFIFEKKNVNSLYIKIKA